MTDTQSAPAEPGFRAPALSVCVSLAAGILADRWLALPWIVWLAAAATCAVGPLVFRNLNAKVAGILIVVCCASIGAVRHHVYTSVAEADDISLFAGSEQQLVRITGTIVGEPETLVRPQRDAWSAYPLEDSSSCALQCRSLMTAAGETPVSGRVRLQVSGSLLDVDVGDVVDVRGWLELARGPANPGGFDFRTYLLHQQQRCVVRTFSPEAIVPVGHDYGLAIRERLAGLRAESEERIARHLSEQNIALANALLLGDRSEIPIALRDAFAASGTMHFLAISGLHVGILAAFLWIVCRLLNLSPRTTTRVSLLAVFGYALLVNLRPPVVRALVMLFAMSFGATAYRPVSAANNLALAAIVVLLWNPTDLFNVGAQLSFLAVAGILMALSILGHLDKLRPSGGIESLAPERWLPDWIHAGWRWLKRGYFVLGIVWLITAPLVAARFHIASPVGLLINVFLMPLVCVIMISGFLCLFCAWALPPLTFVFAFVFDSGLSLLRGVVERCAHLEFGHLHVSGPGDIWLVVLYGLLAALVLPAWHRGAKRALGVSLCLWIVGGLSVGLMPSSQTGLQFTVLATGHGCATIVRFPNGKTLVYDAGNLQEGRRAERIVQHALWEAGASRIDALVVSHADIDHFNGVPGLLRTVPLGSLLLSRPFLHYDQQGVEPLCNLAAENNVPIQLLCRGDRLQIDDQVRVEVLHPGWNSQEVEDNADSIVLLIEYAGRRLLLPGDLEAEGLERLLSLPPRKIDVLLAPHHGGLASNTLRLADWAQPDCVIVSSSVDRSDELRDVYGAQTEVFSTDSAGAITCQIDPAGEMAVEAFRHGD